MKRITAIFLCGIMSLFVLSSCQYLKNPGESQTTTSPVQTVRITFPEGYTVQQVGRLLEDNAVCTQADFLAAINSHSSVYSFEEDINNRENRAFILEGYVFPDTYDFYVDEGAEKALERFLSNMDTLLNAEYKDRAQELGFTMDEIISLASVIQSEASDTAEMGKVSSVLHNRLKIKMQLQCDVTIEYIENHVKPFIDGDKNRYNGYYNTYKTAALPVGAICSPGKAAIEAALYPAESDYLYFFTDAQGAYRYNVTFSQHQKEWYALKTN